MQYSDDSKLFPMQKNISTSSNYISMTFVAILCLFFSYSSSAQISQDLTIAANNIEKTTSITAQKQQSPLKIEAIISFVIEDDIMR